MPVHATVLLHWNLRILLQFSFVHLHNTFCDWLFQTINITGLEPHTFYTVRLSAFTEAGEGPFTEFTVKTDEDGMIIFVAL